jgi:hypothetical protein
MQALSLLTKRGIVCVMMLLRTITLLPTKNVKFLACLMGPRLSCMETESSISPVRKRGGPSAYSSEDGILEQSYTKPSHCKRYRVMAIRYLAFLLYCSTLYSLGETLSLLTVIALESQESLPLLLVIPQAM